MSRGFHVDGDDLVRPTTMIDASSIKIIEGAFPPEGSSSTGGQFSLPLVPGSDGPPGPTALLTSSPVLIDVDPGREL
jgi:hypothetical protein